MATETIYTVAVQYDDTTDILPAEYSDIDDALWMRDKVIATQATEPWEGLQYVYVIANGRVLV